MTEHNSEKNRTSALLRKLFKAPDLENFIESNVNSVEVPTFHAYIMDICKRAEKIPEQVIKQSA